MKSNNVAWETDQMGKIKKTLGKTDTSQLGRTYWMLPKVYFIIFEIIINAKNNVQKMRNNLTPPSCFDKIYQLENDLIGPSCEL